MQPLVAQLGLATSGDEASLIRSLQLMVHAVGAGYWSGRQIRIDRWRRITRPRQPSKRTRSLNFFQFAIEHHHERKRKIESPADSQQETVFLHHPVLEIMQPLFAVPIGVGPHAQGTSWPVVESLLPQDALQLLVLRLFYLLAAAPLARRKTLHRAN